MPVSRSRVARASTSGSRAALARKRLPRAWPALRRRAQGGASTKLGPWPGLRRAGLRPSRRAKAPAGFLPRSMAICEDNADGDIKIAAGGIRMRSWLCSVAFLLACAINPLAAQTNWPEKPVRLVVGFTAGSATDVTGRMFAQKFAEAWGQPVIVDNVSGNSGAIGTDKVAKAAPDGYTLMWSGNAAITILPSLQTLPFDPLKDLAPISTSLSMPSIFLVNNDLPVKSIAELIAYAKANPGKLSLRHAGRRHAAARGGRAVLPSGRHQDGAHPLSRRQSRRRHGRRGAGRHPECRRQPAAGARRPGARHRHHLAQALAQRARPADRRTSRASRASRRPRGLPCWRRPARRSPSSTRCAPNR